MRTSIHVNRPVRVRSTDIKKINALDFGHVDELHAVGRDELPRTSRDFAARVGFVAFEGCFARLVQCARPRLKWNVFNLDVVRQMRICARAIHGIRVHRKLDNTRRRPDSFFTRRRAEIQSAVRPAWSGPWRTTALTAAALRILSNESRDCTQ